MAIYVYPADEQGCGFHRLIWPAQALRAQGLDVRVVLPSMRQGIGGEIDRRTGKLVGAVTPPDAEVVVMQRVSFDNLMDAIPMMRAKGIAVVVDMDDDLDRIDPNNPAFAGLRPGGTGVGRRHSWRNAARACAAATLVTVSTPRLLRTYASHGRGVVLENRIPARYLNIPHEDSTDVGWPGSVHSHPFDLQEIGPAVARLAREGIDYRGVGDREGLRQALGLDEDPETTGATSVHDWAAAVATLGVGMAPLADTAFNEAKSWLKPLEMMACGVPWVASPRVEYARLHALTGAGRLAAKPKDWYRELRRLALSPSLRQDMSETGRETARKWTIEGSAWLWGEVWQSALALQRKMES